MFFKSNFKPYYSRYFNIPESDKIDFLLQKCILADKWLRQNTLNDILNTEYFDNSDNIDTAVDSLQNKISYGLPLLIKPIYDILDPNGMFPRYIEMGAFMPIPRKLIELGIPRETALFISSNFEISNIEDKASVLQQLRFIRDKIGKWHRIPLDNIL